MATELHPALVQALARVHDPEIRRPITELGMVTRADLSADGLAEVQVKLTIVGCPAADQIEREVRAVLADAPEVRDVDLDLAVMDAEERAAFVERVAGSVQRPGSQFGADSLTRVIAVTSGKGGVGKSTVTAALATLLTRRGLRVGVLDADVFGFSMPALLGLPADAKPSRVNELMLPPVVNGIAVISIGMFLEDRTSPVAWRGPMLHRTIEQFLSDVFFGDLDVLLLDLPPGTGDVALSVGQLLPHADVLVVTTPEPNAAEVAVRSGQLAAKLGQRVIGVVENMSGLIGSNGERIEVFGSGGGARVATDLTAALGSAVPLLGAIWLEPGFNPAGAPQPHAAAQTDAVARADTETPAWRAFAQLADAVLATGRSIAGTKLPLRPTR